MFIPLRRSFPVLPLGSSQASWALATASTAWMLSGLTSSPLVNGLLPALCSGVALLSLGPDVGRGYALQALALLLWIAVALHWMPDSGVVPVLITLMATLLWALGRQWLLSGLHRHLLTGLALPLPLLGSGAEAGQLLGHLLTGLLFPLGRAVSQFAVALLLLLPLLFLRRHRGDPVRPATVEPGVLPQGPRDLLPNRWQRQALLQGLLFGALFAMLPLWVRRLSGGTCFDFGMVLTAYGLGRTLAPGLAAQAWASCPRVATTLPYPAMALLLLAASWLPGWGAVALFLPFGLLAGLSDQRLLAGRVAVDGIPDLAGFERSGSLGGLIGTLLMAGITQVTGLGWALPLQMGAFLLAALLLRRRPSAASLA